LTTSGGRFTVICCPPTGDAALGADKEPGVGAVAALCEIVNDVPAIVSVAVRAAPVLAAIVKVTVPLPLPDAPAVIAANVALLVAVQVQPVPAVTATVALPPAAPNVDALMAPAVTVHDVGGVGVVGVSSFEHPYAAMRSIIAASSRREVIMAPSIH
jgi:hypothetical protein